MPSLTGGPGGFRAASKEARVRVFPGIIIITDRYKSSRTYIVITTENHLVRVLVFDPRPSQKRRAGQPGLD